VSLEECDVSDPPPDPRVGFVEVKLPLPPSEYPLEQKYEAVNFAFWLGRGAFHYLEPPRD
jgi:hypothetical protein